MRDQNSNGLELRGGYLYDAEMITAETCIFWEIARKGAPQPNPGRHKGRPFQARQLGEPHRGRSHALKILSVGFDKPKIRFGGTDVSKSGTQEI